MTHAQSTIDAALNRSYDYDEVGRLWEAHSGNEADAHVNGQPFPAANGPFSHSYRYDVWGNMTYRVGWGGFNGSYTNRYQSFTNNRQHGLTYDAAGNLTNDGGQWFEYDAAGRQTYASASNLSQAYDGDALRARKTDNGQTTYYLRSSVLGHQVVCDLNASGGWVRGYV